MVFLVLNIIALVSLVFIAVYVDKRMQIDTNDGNALMVPVLLATVESAVFTLTLTFRSLWFSALTTQLMRIVLLLDAIFLVNFSFMMLAVAMKKRKPVFRVIRLILYVFAGYIIYWHFKTIDIDDAFSLVIGADEYLFSEGATEYFPWTWVTLFYGLYKFVIPVVCFIFSMLIMEKRESEIGKYQLLLVGEAVVVMWLLVLFFQFVETATPAFSTLFPFAYIFMLFLTITALTRTSIPSFRGELLKILRIVGTSLLPACIVGGLVMLLQPRNSIMYPNFITALIFIAVAAFILVIKGTELLSNSSRIYNADYSTALEKDLSSINYNDEMDAITDRMNDIFHRRVEASSMNVYVLNNDGMLEVAYSSNGFSRTVSPADQIFNHLLNINKSIVCYVELENGHELSSIAEPLKTFFDETGSDALFVLNEGRNIFGLMTLGKKLSGDHYKEYDYNVFNRLYSYFFVFGYYMRNISNKDVISVVNRELRMSSQIITSIQENLEHVKNKKIDTGYLMVPAHNIGGEFIDLIRLTSTRHLFVVGDLSGKGIAASMNMVILKSIIRAYLSEIHDFKELVVRVNTFVRESLPKGTIFAGLFALIDFETDTMYYINCGVPALFLYTRVYNNVIEIQGGGHVLGFVKDLTPYVSVKTTKLSSGDIILACTDGLIQSHSLRGEQFGKERVQQAILDNSTYNAQRMAQFTFDSLLKFMSKEMEDDVSILVLKYAGEEEPEVQNTSVPEKELPKESVLAAGADFMSNVEAFVEPGIQGEVSDQGSATGTAPAESVEPVVDAADFPAPETVSQEEPPAVEEPSDMDIPDLSNLDDMLKMAGL